MRSVFHVPLELPPWQIVQPVAVRYMESEYVNEFLSRGLIRLSTCARFSRHPDEQRQDQHEGMVRVSAKLNGGSFDGVLCTPSDAVVLSTSCVEGAQNGKEINSSYDSAFRINDVIGFATAIAKALPGYSGGFQGYCFYRDSKHIDISDIASQMRINEPPPRSESEAEAHFARMQSVLAARSAYDALLRKPVKYRAQNEYRFVWFTQAATDKDYIDVIVPEAAAFCERVVENESGLDLTSRISLGAMGGIEITMLSEQEAKALIAADDAARKAE